MASNTEYYFVFGALLAITLSLLWVGTTLWFVAIAFTDGSCNVGASVSNVTSDGYECPTSAFVEVHNVTFGLVSATVVAQLAITSPGKNPSDHLMKGITDSRKLYWIKWIPAFYVASWGLVGLLALIAGSLSYNAVVLRTTGFSFLGNAIAATYAYFGIDPKIAAAGDGEGG